LQPQISALSPKPSFDSGSTQAVAKTSGIQETTNSPKTPEEKKESDAPKDKRDIIKESGILELVEVDEGPWHDTHNGYPLFSIVRRAASLGWKYVVRHKTFGTVLLGKGTPLDSWPLNGPTRPDTKNPHPDRLHALVQAAIDFYDGVDPWLTVNGVEDLQDFPYYSDPRFEAAYKARLNELDPDAHADT
jgi:hypothetical protein